MTIRVSLKIIVIVISIKIKIKIIVSIKRKVKYVYGINCKNTCDPNLKVCLTLDPLRIILN